MPSSIDEACETVQAAAVGKSRAEIRRMLAAEFRSRDAPPLSPELFEVAVDQIAAGTYVAGEPLVSVHCTGLLRVPFIRKALRHAFESAVAEHGLEGVFQPGVVWVSDHVADAWPVVSRGLPHPPGRGLYAPEPDRVPPRARLVPDPDLRERMPQLFQTPPLPPTPPGMPSPEEADLVFVWLEESAGAVAAWCRPGRIGILDAADTEAYLPLVRAAHAQDKVVAATADIRLDAHDLLPATVRVVPDRGSGLTAGTASPGG
jgi:hypothetical protein